MAPIELTRRSPWHPTPVLLPGKSHGRRSRVGCSPWDCKESDSTERLHFHALEKEMATHSSVLAWRIPGMGEPDGLPSMGSHRVGDDWSDLAAAADRVNYYVIIEWGYTTVVYLPSRRQLLKGRQSPQVWTPQTLNAGQQRGCMCNNKCGPFPSCKSRAIIPEASQPYQKGNTGTQEAVNLRYC